MKGDIFLTEYKAYVDGSYNRGKIGYGVVILKDEKIIKKLSGGIQTGDFSNHRQVGGELMAAIKVIQWCEASGVDSITIYYDYIGIREWATGKWKTNKIATKKYKEFVRNCDLEIKWVKVDAHTGDKYNEMADKLAFEGRNIREEEFFPGAGKPKKKAGFQIEMIEDAFREKGFSVKSENVERKYTRMMLSKNGLDYGHLDIYDSDEKFVPVFIETDGEKREEIIEIFNSL